MTLQFAKPETNQTDSDVLMLEASEDVIQPETQPLTSTQIVLTSIDETQAMDISESDIP